MQTIIVFHSMVYIQKDEGQFKLKSLLLNFRPPPAVMNRIGIGTRFSLVLGLVLFMQPHSHKYNGIYP